MSNLLDKRWPWIVAAALIILAYLSTVVRIQFPGDDRRPIGSPDDIERLKERSDTNVLFILIDTLRADRLGSYGYERPTSPEIDRVASLGVRFDRHLAQSSWTKCSMASLWTSLYPQRSGITRYDDVIPDVALLPAERLKAAGFRTVGLYRNGWVSSNFGFAQGFDQYSRPAVQPQRRSVRIDNPTVLSRGTDEDTLATALEFLRVQGDERWFLYLHLMDIHEYVYDEESALFGSAYSDVYDNSILWLQHVIEVLLQNLDVMGYANNTLVVISADHGEAFGERGLEGHARHIYKETTEVPFILSFPFKLQPGIVVEARTRNVDVWPTIFDLIGIEFSSDIDGRSLVPDILASARGAGPQHSEGVGFAHLDQHWGQRKMEPAASVTITDGTFRYVREFGRGGLLESLFDASADPDELKNLAADSPEAIQRFRLAADEYLEAVPPWGEVPTRAIDELELNQLRALGYAIP